MAKLKTGRHTSAIKAARQAKKKASHNRGVRKQIRSSAHELLAAVSAKDPVKAQKFLSETASKWDKAAKSGVIHWKTAARRKSRLSKRVNSIATAK
ncbi:MAG: 30S ribosomal protein S20 [Elusimicrobia bacterium]|nr:30S ribosomal protein S20 [Elusimicrobiota bacterium]